MAVAFLHTQRVHGVVAAKKKAFRPTFLEDQVENALHEFGRHIELEAFPQEFERSLLLESYFGSDDDDGGAREC